MATTYYTLKSNAARAARRQGLDTSAVKHDRVYGYYVEACTKTPGQLGIEAAREEAAERQAVAEGLGAALAADCGMLADLRRPAKLPADLLAHEAELSAALDAAHAYEQAAQPLAPKAAPAAQAARASRPEVVEKRRKLMAAADAKGLGSRWAPAVEAAKAGTLPQPPDFEASTHTGGRKHMAEAVAAVEAGSLAALQAVIYDPTGSTGAMLHRFVYLAKLALSARQ